METVNGISLHKMCTLSNCERGSWRSADTIVPHLDSWTDLSDVW